MVPDITPMRPGGIAIRDCTLREGRDVPGVDFSIEQTLAVARMLAKAGVPEAEIVAPGRVRQDLEPASRVRAEGIPLRTSGLVYASRPQCREEIDALSACVDRVDLLMPVADGRAPHDRGTKKRLLLDALRYAQAHPVAVGVGFPNATQVDPEFVLEMCVACAEGGATRIVIYDTNGSADPVAIDGLIRRLASRIEVPLFFHAHNDLGLATANAFAAARAGAAGLDVTVNGIGDRAGNASLEQVAMVLHLRGFQTGIALDTLRALSDAVARECGIAVSKLAPVVGEFVATHKAPGHLEAPGLFEAFDAALVGLTRRFDG